jgi:signal transduction histidine kinase
MLTVQRMLEFYRPDSASMADVSLNEALDHVLLLMSKQLGERRIEVRRESPPDLPAVRAVGSQVQQVLLNLVLNALDAMPEGGSLEIRARSVRRGVEVTFEDSGPGIPAEQQARIFDPFFSTKQNGTGLGLTVSYNIITAHGGALEVVPGTGSGACFRLFLPSGGKR